MKKTDAVFKAASVEFHKVSKTASVWLDFFTAA